MKVGFRIERQGSYVIMTNGEVDLVIPRNNAFTMGGIIVQAGLTVSEFRDLL